MRITLMICGIAALFIGMANPAKCPGQSVEIDERSSEVISAFIDALGGEDALRGNQTFRCIATTLDVVDGHDSSDVYRDEIFVDGIKLRRRSLDKRIVDFGTLVWDGRQRWRTRTNDITDVWLEEIDYHPFAGAPLHEIYLLPGAILGWTQFRGKVEYAGKTQVDGRACHHLKFHFQDGSILNRWFDTSTHLLVCSNPVDPEPGTRRFYFESIGEIKFVTRTTYIERQDDTDDTIVHETRYVYDFRTPVPTGLFAMPDKIKFDIEQRATKQKHKSLDKKNRQSGEVMDRFLEAMGGEMVLTRTDQFRVFAKAEYLVTSRIYTWFSICVKADKMRIQYREGGTVINDANYSCYLPKDDQAEVHNRYAGSSLPCHDRLPFPTNIIRWRQVAQSIDYYMRGEIKGIDVDTLDLWIHDGLRCQLFFDRKSGLLAGLRQIDGDIVWYEYDTVDELPVVVREKILKPDDGTVLHTVEYEYEFDVELSDELFAFPERIQNQIKDLKKHRE